MAVLNFAERVCPVCAATDRSTLYADARFDPGRLDGMSFSSRKAPEGMHLRLLECGRCDILYASPLPVTDDLTSAYREADYDSQREARFAAETYARVLAGIVPDLPSRRGAVDIGAGDGAFMERLAAAGFEDIVGFEPSRSAIASARADVKPQIRPEPFDDSQLAPGAYSLVSCLQTIEHVPDPLGLCRSAAALLEPGGAMLIVCHNRKALTAKVLRHRSPIFDIEHLQLFSPDGVRALLGRAGFERITVNRLVNRYPLGYWLRLAPGPAGVKAATAAALGRVRLDGLPLSVPAGNLVAVGHRQAP